MADIIPFNFGAHAVRVITRDNLPWFVASDVCAALGYTNTSKAIGDHLDTDERYNESLDRGGSLLLISESGLYALVLRSRKPEARKFAKWVTGEVLPSIRQTGQYSLQPAQIPDASLRAEQTANAVAEAVRQHVLAELQNKPGWTLGRWLLSFNMSEQGAQPSIRMLEDGEGVVSRHKIGVDRQKLLAIYQDLGKLRSRVDGLAMMESDLPPEWWTNQSIHPV